MMRIPIGLGQPAVEAIELIASGDKVVTRLGRLARIGRR